MNLTADELLTNMEKLRILNKEFMYHIFKNNHTEATRCVEEMKSIQLYTMKEED